LGCCCHALACSFERLACIPQGWVSRSLRHLVKALAAQGFKASQRVVANLLRELNYSC
jgi:hypothetical protein